MTFDPMQKTLITKMEELVAELDVDPRMSTVRAFLDRHATEPPEFREALRECAQIAFVIVDNGAPREGDALTESEDACPPGRHTFPTERSTTAAANAAAIEGAEIPPALPQ